MTPFDRNGLEILSREECLRLLGDATIGRIAITSGALPVILPVNFRVDGDRILFRTERGSKLDAATRGAVVAFEIDDFDPLYHGGWSVLVRGVARAISDPAPEVAQTTARWAPRGEGHFVSVSLDEVSGRRLVGG